ncbi:cytochrome C biogenesis protein transmembrane region [Mycolicibacterium mageritense DSM 44476 = CIP 104973]|uniref:Cytochrome C biogenesis protein CcdA n=1 Tax=Mycolicibacterium mageritense TaxID=53462 RepID=A0ABN5YJA6_MYCME|nr:cytochrome c biogenesis CcdA family protein [Mycolicibacterium mageritense]MCC9184882.1 cytochrome c biogenesis CcdA family protein [Mycolicibacterium mageritense]BBX37287.1 cytochrome C biogenesis protein CcdA [Mycolicibacterium mageritense]CDO26045.1 cytochrome C biogenesis protein transmembrane region [Mycolicibacterium mageritense DSM 44476 = CIP 104973]
MNDNLLGLAFGAGLVAALNPCGFALLPGYLAFAVRGGSSSGALSALSRAVLATTVMTAGFVAVFGAFGALTVAAAGTVQRYLPYATMVIGLLLIGLGGWLLAGRHFGLLVPGVLARRTRWAPSARLGSMFGYGVGYAVASLSCTAGPFLAVTGAGMRSGTPTHTAGVFLAYAAGFALIVGVLAVAAALAGTAVVDRLRRIVPYVNRISGALLIVVGAYVTYYGLYEVRLFTAGGNPTDPVIAAAGRLQGTLAGWVHRHGALPWVVTLGGLVALALIWWTVVRFGGSNRRARPATAAGAPSPASRKLLRPGR